MATSEEKLSAIREYVWRERIRRGIIPSQQEPDIKLSCFEVGEYFNLVERQLLTTEEGFGAWLELAYPPVLDGAYYYIAERT